MPTDVTDVSQFDRDKLMNVDYDSTELAKEADEWVKRDLEDAIKHLDQFEGETDVVEAGFRGNWF